MLWKKFVGRTKLISDNLKSINIFMGVILIISAVFIYTGYDKKLQVRLLEYFPSISSTLIEIENNPIVQTELDKLTNTETTNSILKPQGKKLPKIKKAPEIIGIESWVNSDELKLADLRGKVVLIDFWTYTCINCIRTLPHVTGWFEKYKDEGLVVIGVHTPEFEFEKDLKNVKNAVVDFKINYPVSLDNDYSTWRNFNNRYWPAKYLIGKDGYIRYTHFGEGKYEETEEAIVALLSEIDPNTKSNISNMPDETPKNRRTPELYLGYSRMSNLQKLKRAPIGVNLYSSSGNPSKNNFSFNGKWNVTQEYSEAIENSSLTLNFSGDKVFLVIKPLSENDVIEVFLDGKLIDENSFGADVENGIVKLDKERLYEIVNFKGKNSQGILELKFKTGGTKIFAFTFG
jgi:thiol-disulfide isomerase/thioredoxin